MHTDPNLAQSEVPPDGLLAEIPMPDDDDQPLELLIAKQMAEQPMWPRIFPGL